MKLRFNVNPAKGTADEDKHKASVATIEVDHEEFDHDERLMISDRLHGIDVLQLWNSDKGTTKFFMGEDGLSDPVRIVATEPTLHALMVAVEMDHDEVTARQNRHRACAWGAAISGFDVEQAVAA